MRVESGLEVSIPWGRTDQGTEVAIPRHLLPVARGLDHAARFPRILQARPTLLGFPMGQQIGVVLQVQQSDDCKATRDDVGIEFGDQERGALGIHARIGHAAGGIDDDHDIGAVGIGGVDDGGCRKQCKQR